MALDPAGSQGERSPSKEWADLVEDWRAKHDALLDFLIYAASWMKTQLLTEYDTVVPAERSARSRMDAFIAAHPGTGAA